MAIRAPDGANNWLKQSTPGSVVPLAIFILTYTHYVCVMCSGSKRDRIRPKNNHL